MKELVSVIIPNYNHGQYIAECIKSVIAQTYSDIEILVIDNFSNDNTAQAVNEIINQNSSVTIKFLQFNNNGIIAASRNFGVKHAAGTYLAFLDSDDVWEPSKLEVQVDQLQKSKYAAVATRFNPIGEIAYCYDHLAYMTYKGDIIVSYQDILISNPIVTSSFLMRKEHFLKLGGFDESPEYRFIEDWELWLRLTKQFGDIKILNSKMVNYRVYKIKGRDLSDDARRSMLIIDKHYKLGFISKDLYNHSRASAYVNYAGKCIQSSKRYERVSLIKSFLYSKQVRGKFRSVVFLFLSFLPIACRSSIRNILYRTKVRRHV